MKNKMVSLSKISISLLIIISILLNSPVYAEEIKLNSGSIIPITYLDNNRFEIKRNVYSNGKLLFSKRTVGSRNVGHVVDVYGKYHYFTSDQQQVISNPKSAKKKSLRFGEHGPKVLPLVGAVVATAVAVPVVAFLGVVEASAGSGSIFWNKPYSSIYTCSIFSRKSV